MTASADSPCAASKFRPAASIPPRAGIGDTTLRSTPCRAIGCAQAAQPRIIRSKHAARGMRQRPGPASSHSRQLRQALHFRHLPCVQDRQQVRRIDAHQPPAGADSGVATSWVLRVPSTTSRHHCRRIIAITGSRVTSRARAVSWLKAYRVNKSSRRPGGANSAVRKRSGSARRTRAPMGDKFGLRAACNEHVTLARLTGDTPGRKVRPSHRFC